MVDHFAKKMSNAADAEDNEWEPADGKSKRMVFFKVDFKKVLKSLQGLDVDKSVNSIANHLLKRCAEEIAPSLDKLFKLIVGRSEYPSFWKIGRITALHKRKEVTLAKNYRPVTVVPNEDMVFEDVLSDQLYNFLVEFIPLSQFGFLKKCGTQDYGAVVSMKIMRALENRNEIIAVALDVDGAFDRVWHKGLLKKLKKRGMRGRALRLLKSYLKNRFIEVVRGIARSRRRLITSSVPQGGKWSAPLWDYDIATLDELEIEELFAYADDLGLIYEVTDENYNSIIDHINEDFDKLEKWAKEWNVTFAADKTEAMVISRKKKAFDISALRFKGEEVEQVKEIKLVGFTFDEKMTMEPMIKKASKKGRAKIAALYRLKPYLDSENLETMYKAFVRSSMEYGNLEYMAGAPTHLLKLDRIQAAAEKLGGFKVESLESRRDASLIGLLFKVLDGDGRGKLDDFKPTIETLDPIRKGRHTTTGLQLKDQTNADSLLCFERSIAGRAHEVWKKLPQGLLTSKGEGKWQSITKNCQRALTGKKLKQEKSEQKQSKQKTQFEWNDQSDKHSLFKGLEIKLNPLFDQSIKSIINA